MVQANADEQIVVTSIEVKTPLAARLNVNAAALRAGISAYAEFPDYYPLLADEEADSYPAIAVFDPEIDEYGWKRLMHITEKAFLSFVGETGFDRKKYQQAAIWFALPYSDNAVQNLGIQQHFLPHLIERFSMPSECEITGFQLGATGVGYLVNQARRALDCGRFKFVIIVAVDSYLLDGRISMYDQQWRLKSDRNPTGFVPGEGIGIMLMETASSAMQRTCTPLFQISGVGLSQEFNPITSDKSSSGTGLSQAIEIALEAVIEQPVKYLFSDLNGESYRAFEWGVVSTRLAQYFDQKLEHIYPAEAFGELGSVAMMMSLGCFSEALKGEYAPDSNALIFVASDSGQRAALYVSQITT